MKEISINKTVLVTDPPFKQFKQQFRGRKGIVIRMNPCSRINERGGLWWVKLEATSRSKETIESFFGDQLKVIEND